MNKRRSRPAKTLSFDIETLESRIVLSGVGSTAALPQGTVEVAPKAGQNAATGTTLAVSSGTLAQPIKFTVTVQAAASAGAPTGTVKLIQKGRVFDTLTLSPASSSNATQAVSSATYTMTIPPGGAPPFIGKYAVTAEFIPSGSFQRSSATKSFAVSQPTYKSLTGGVKIATVAPGSGAAIQTGQTASVLYTGYLASNGKVFDDSLNDGGPAFNFTVGAGQVIPGFDEGTVGMKVGETRIVEIPPKEGYGAEVSSSIPANSTLIFVLTLEAIS